MTKNSISIILLIVIGGGALLGYYLINQNQEKEVVLQESQCEFKEMIFYYRDDCSWCQKVKKEDTISKIEALGVNVQQVNTKIGPIRHQFQGVPTFVINDEVYSGYKTFEELKGLLNCSEEEQIASKEFFGEKGEQVALIDEEVSLSVEIFDDNLAHFYNTQLPDDKTLYFFAIKDENNVYRAAANACQVCFDSRMGFRQEGDDMICNTCGNRYPLEKIATEKGGCNPGPINPNLEVRNGKIIIKQSDLEQVSEFF